MPGRPEHNRNRLLELQQLGFGEKSISISSPYSNRRAGVSAKTQAELENREAQKNLILREKAA